MIDVKLHVLYDSYFSITKHDIYTIFAVNKYLYFYVILFLMYFQMLNSTHLSGWQVSKAQTRATHLLSQCSQSLLANAQTC